MSAGGSRSKGRHFVLGEVGGGRKRERSPIEVCSPVVHITVFFGRDVKVLPCLWHICNHAMTFL